VTVAGELVGVIGPGLCILVGVTHTDTAQVAAGLADQVWHLRVFDDEAGVMNRALSDRLRPEALCVSQFTLYGDTSRGRRPSWAAAAPPEAAEPLVAAFADRLAEHGVVVATGWFGAEMQVELVNDGPVTLLLERGVDKRVP
jgi:D-tyrosyl-tRNA(Tyr) deacylase